MLGARPRPGRGLEDIAASQGHWPFVERFLDFGMRHAVKRHTSGIEVPNLDDPNMIRLVGGMRLLSWRARNSSKPPASYAHAAVGQTPAFPLARRVTTMWGRIPALKVSMPRTWRNNCDFGKQGSDTLWMAAP
jgi:hypothetical protein